MVAGAFSSGIRKGSDKQAIFISCCGKGTMNASIPINLLLYVISDWTLAGFWYNHTHRRWIRPGGRPGLQIQLWFAGRRARWVRFPCTSAILFNSLDPFRYSPSFSKLADFCPVVLVLYLLRKFSENFAYRKFDKKRLNSKNWEWVPKRVPRGINDYGLPCWFYGNHWFESYTPRDSNTRPFDS